jgi:hypothetical protein
MACSKVKRKEPFFNYFSVLIMQNRNLCQEIQSAVCSKYEWLFSCDDASRLDRLINHITILAPDLP